MKMLKVIEKRRSVREYKEKHIPANVIEGFKALLDKRPTLNLDENIKFLYIEDGASVYKALDGVAGYNGVMIEAPHYMAILSEKSSNYLKVAGYLAEWLILHMTKEDVGTCWIETANKSDKVKQLLEIESQKEIVGLIAMGYSKMEHRLSHIYDTSKSGSVSPLTDLGYPHIDPNYSKEPVSNRKSIEDIVYLNKWGNMASTEKLTDYGLAEVFYYMRMAPSWGNRQPWKFVVTGDQIILAIDGNNPYTEDANDQFIAEIEAGIAMLYFEVAMHDEGLPGHWNFECDSTDYEIPDTYFVAGCYTYN